MKDPTWVGGRFPSRFIIEQPAPYRPDLVLWLDTSNDFLLVADVVEPDAPPSILREHLEAALAQPTVRRPGRVRVQDPAAADSIRSALGANIAIEVGPTPELTAIARLMEEQLAGQGQSAGEGRLASYLEGGVLLGTAIEALFRECAALYRAAPWRTFADADVLEMDIPVLGIEGACVSVLGAGKQNYGVLVFDSLGDFEQFASQPRPLDQGEELDLGVGFLSLGFERGADLAPEMRREISAQGWPVAGPKAYPVLWPIERDANVRARSPRDVRIVCAAVSGLVALVRKHGRQLRTPFPDAVVATFTVETPEPTEVTLRFPHPAIADGFDAGDDAWDQEQQRVLEQVEERVRQYLAALEHEGVPAAAQQDAAFVCHSLYRFKVDFVDGSMGRLGPDHVEEFLLEHYPRKVSAGRDLIERTPDILDRYFQWLGPAGLESATNVRGLRERLARVRDEFLSVAGDPARFGMAKTFAMAMHEAGVDFSDERAVAGYIEEYNRNLDRRPSARAPRQRQRTKTSAPDLRDRAAPQRWEPKPDQLAPEPSSPCPCGSGKRYKRCCMPR